MNVTFDQSFPQRIGEGYFKATRPLPQVSYIIFLVVDRSYYPKAELGATPITEIVGF